MKDAVYIIILSTMLVIPCRAYADEILVEGKPEQSPAAVDIIDISDADRQTKTMSELLESRVGVQVTRYGSSSSIYVRGTNANQIAVYIDGMPLTDSVFGETNFENIPIDSIERIEIYRSFAPLSFPSQGIGGAINLVTKKKHSGTGASIAIGSFGTEKAAAFHTFDGKAGNLLLTGALSRSSGNFPFTNNNGTNFNSSDDFSDTRRNNGFREGNITARYSFKSGDTAIDALSDFFAKNQGVASYNNSAAHASLDTVRSINSVKLSLKKIGGTSLSTELSAFANVRRDTFNDMDNEIGLLAGKTTGTYLTFGTGCYGTIPLQICQQLSVSLREQSEYYYVTKQTLSSSQNAPSQQRHCIRAGLEDSFTFLDRRIIITPQLRWEIRHDIFNTDGSASKTAATTDPQAGALIWIAKDLLYTRTSAGICRRAPTFSELFGDRGTVRGNSTLKDERSENFEAAAGITHDDFSSEILQSFGIEYAYFRTRMRNIIFFMQDSQFTMVAQNISAASITGHELSIHATLFNHVELSGNATIQYAIDESDIAYYRGNYLPHRPIMESSAKGKLFNGIGSISYEFSYAGANFRDRANSEALYIRQRIFHTVSATWTPRYDLTVIITAKNIADSRTQDVAGYPLPGRSITGSVQYIF